MPTSVPPLKDQIVVALAHQGIVEQRLRRFGVRPSEVDSDSELGLALLNLDTGPDPEQASGGGPNTARGLDGLLLQLYTSFENDYGQWVPTIGKNREVNSVVTWHTIGGGGEGDPRAELMDWPARAAVPGAGVQVAVADTAVAARPQLVGSILAGPDSLLADGNGDGFAEGADKAPLPASAGHATFVAGLIARKAPGATIRVARVLGDDGLSDSWQLAKSIVRLSRSGVNVLNLSLGCFTEDNRPPLVLMTAIDRLDPGTVVVAAAGNHGKDEKDAGRPAWPAALDDVVAVGATNRDGSPMPWSPDPAANPWVDVLAGGAEVVSTYLAGPVRVTDRGGKPRTVPFHGFASWSGTSFAAARVSGMIAARAKPPAVSPARALDKLVASARGSAAGWDNDAARPFLG